MNIKKYKSNSKEKLIEYNELYDRCFDNYKYNTLYLDWLYNQNPEGKFVGIDFLDNEKLIGQVGGIPHEFIFKDKKVKFLISVNVCVDPKYQGRWIFSKMLLEFERIAKYSNFDGIIGIANKAASPFWQRSIKLKKLKKLDVYLGYGQLDLKNFKKTNYNFYTMWNKSKLEWRINNPLYKTFIQSQDGNYSVYSKTKYKFVNAYSPLIFLKDEVKFIKLDKNYKPIVYVGLVKDFKKSKFLIKFPDKLKPSPLNFLYKFFRSDTSLDIEKIFFTYLDFDVF